MQYCIFSPDRLIPTIILTVPMPISSQCIFLPTKLQCWNHKINGRIIVNLLKISNLTNCVFWSESRQNCAKSCKKRKVKVLESSLKLGSGGLQFRRFYALMTHGITYRDASHASVGGYPSKGCSLQSGVKATSSLLLRCRCHLLRSTKKAHQNDWSPIPLPYGKSIGIPSFCLFLVVFLQFLTFFLCLYALFCIFAG